MLGKALHGPKTWPLRSSALQRSATPNQNLRNVTGQDCTNLGERTVDGSRQATHPRGGREGYQGDKKHILHQPLARTFFVQPPEMIKDTFEHFFHL